MEFRSDWMRLFYFVFCRQLWFFLNLFNRFFLHFYFYFEFSILIFWHFFFPPFSLFTLTLTSSLRRYFTPRFENPHPCSARSATTGPVAPEDTLESHPRRHDLHLFSFLFCSKYSGIVPREIHFAIHCQGTIDCRAAIFETGRHNR